MGKASLASFSKRATPQNGAFVLAIVLAGLVACPVAARTVTVASCDRETGETTLAISAAEAGDGAKALVAAWSPYDVGNAVTNARETVYVGAVAAAETEKSFTIPSAWRAKAGFVRFFLMADVPPYDVRLASLRSVSAGPYIDTGFVPTTNSDIRVTAYYPRDMASFGVSGTCYLFSNQPAAANKTSAHYFGFFGVSGTTSVAPRDLFPHEYQINAKGAYVDGICRSPFDPSALAGTTTSTLTLFARKNDGTSTVAKQGDCTIYAAQIRENGTLEHDYVPCMKNNVATMYDRAKGTFCAVSGSGAFTAGDEVGPDAADCGGVESFSGAIPFGPALTVTAVDAVAGEMTVSIAGAHDAGVLYAVGGPTDAGAGLAGWAETNFVCKVAAGTQSVVAPVPSAWWGNGWQVRFLWRSAEDFPYDREVEWLYSAGSAWVNSLVIPTRETEVTVCGKGNSNVCLFGLTEYLYLFSNGTTYYGYFGQSGSFANYGPTAFHTLSIGPAGVFVDGTQKVAFPGGGLAFAALGKALPIFFRRDSSTGDINKNGPCWIKSARLAESGRLVRDFVPCVSNGVAYLYDKVSGAFFGSETSAAFEPGETVVRIADADALAWSGPAAARDASATWDGGGADDSFATAANWEGDALPDLASGATVLTFATGGTSARVIAPSSALGLRFDSASDFALTGAPGASLALGVGGVTLAPNAVSGSWRFSDIGLPLVLTADQTWDLSSESKQRIRLQGNLQGAADRTLTVTGDGCLSLYSTNDFAGTVRLEGGVTKVFSKERPFGSAAEGGEIVIDQLTGRAVLQSFGAVIDKPIALVGADVSSSRFSFRGSYGTNVVAAAFTQTGDRLNWYLEGNSVTTLAGGGSFAGPVHFDPADTALRTLVVEGAPIIQPTLGNRDMAFKFHGKTELHLKNPGNRMYIELGASQQGSGSSLHCWTNDVLNYQCDIILGYGSTLDLHGFDQQVGDLQTGSAGRIRSDEPATLLAYYNDGDGKTWGANCGVDGAVTFRKSGPKPLTINGTNTTTGALVAFAGQLVMGATACWQGTDVCVGLETSNRHPSLRLTRSDSFPNARHTVLTMTATTSSSFFTDCGDSREPELILDAGVNAVFKDVILNGRRLASGTWGGPDSPAQNKDGTHFSGTGMITVIGSGTMVIFR